MDWPLSQNEKKGRLLELYDKEVRANDHEEAGHGLLDWQSTVRSAVGGRGRLAAGEKPPPATVCVQAPGHSEQLSAPWEWQCVLAKAAEAAAVTLGALLTDGLGSLTSHRDESPGLRLRARSESSKLLRPALRGPESCARAKRVHFADAAEPEPEVPAPSEPVAHTEDHGRSRSPGRRYRRSRLRERLHGFGES